MFRVAFPPIIRSTYNLSTESGTCQTVTATYRYRGRVGTALQYLHPSSGAYTTVSTASGTCQTVTATCR